MYGLINKAVRQFVEQQYGTEVWEEVRRSSEIEEDGFLNFQSYPDKVTYDVVESLSKCTGISGSQLLEEIGVFWSVFTGAEKYKHILRLGGSTFPAFVSSLNEMRTRVAENFSDLKPPSFSTPDFQDNCFVVHYHSDRPALLPMVVGILKGMGIRFDMIVEVEILNTKDQGHDYDEMRVTYTPP
ncbi:MAG: heme NO-binding domain-containing protein [bacterium]|nr:hypothetical protein [Gammaproteobacteria bacterium]HIL98620.1 hypothetical protein [Pseudomonadales bacterium]